MGGGDNRHSGDRQGQWTESGKVPDAYLHDAAGSVCERLQISSTFLHDMINMREKKRFRSFSGISREPPADPEE